MILKEVSAAFQLNSFLKSGGVDINEVNSKLVARLRTDVSDVSEDG